MEEQRSFSLDGLDCANCAAKIEEKMSTFKEFNDVEVNFVHKKLSMTVDKKMTNAQIIEIVQPAIDKIEAGIVVGKYKEKTDEDDVKAKKIFKRNVYILIAALVLFFGALLIPMSDNLSLILLLISYGFVGLPVVKKSIKNISKGQVFDENFLMAIATIGAFIIGEYPEGVAVMLFYQVGELFQTYAVNNSRRSISSLMDIRPDFANIMDGDQIKKVDPKSIKIGDVILVKVGEKVPLDGIITEGQTSLDTAALTGESKYRKAGVGDEVLSGSINTSGVISLQVTKSFGESTVSKILELVENATSKKSNAENFITKFAKYYTPVVVFIAIGLATIPPLLGMGEFVEYLNRALVFLVISCPCALVVSIPLSYFSGIGAASKNGVLVKGSNYLEALNEVNTVIFDKTGTLTVGDFSVNKISTANGYDQDVVLELAAYAESFSNHPIAVSLKKEYKQDIKTELLSDYKEISGHGIKVNYQNDKLIVGNDKLMKLENIDYQDNAEIGTVVHVAVNGVYAGYILIKDTIKPTSKDAIASLKQNGIEKVVMLTGDNKLIAESVANELGIDEFYGELLPTDKFDILESIDAQGTGKIAFVGDGINDAPVIARSDVGIAMGGVGSDAAIESADIVLMNDNPMSIASAKKIAKITQNIVIQNIVFALAVKLLVLLFGFFGFATMWEAVFADVGVSVLAILNAMRIQMK